ncbi:hypothetical protein B0T26DRAFT_724207 [Lasiosphaeria miniovina]|uniref:Nephrocystin 3-like N-terminal domain-containing protein n=1 Tax=Lasiosphaeria miniovina TaxID=1954250 RepID=A0AA40DNF3_9PEZI|nr:uncharacterized protein B0T26DRAFT_724207 [Lasiosphaeria miniovina]KAK0710149.1 hypothetical protein B0T26DRAFT_724207 [Lasiosphaeria miniovina]
MQRSRPPWHLTLRVDGGLASGVAAGGGEDGLSVPEEVPEAGSDEPVAGVDAVGRGVSKRPKVPLSILKDFILDGLAYKSMRDREEEVTEAHGKTFECIFGAGGDSTDTGKQHSGGHAFRTWLEADGLGPLFWISGKPGSGKSTLTRFLSDTARRRSASTLGPRAAPSRSVSRRGPEMSLKRRSSTTRSRA